MPRGEANIREVAQYCNVGPRRLQRILAGESTSLSELIEQVRREVGLELLTNGRTSIAEVSSAIGYESPSILISAVKGWTGKTPSELVLESFRPHI
ncbi:helix-turn-helix transcriptional regulator [Mesorhizobium jarvisii]|uniref:helix-turn-helix transcriptional regulator n=1 Tax=Mesorhizobium jarvisii TaxID=1777867 RepID=UPI0023E83697|nr:helix-turn-helix transcriptional regulator [Mesorhizobium jarvisii]